MEELTKSVSQREELLSTEAVWLAAGATGGPARWFLWFAPSGQEITRIVPDPLSWAAAPISVSKPGQTIDADARFLKEATEQWRKIPHTETSKQRRTPLGRRLAEIRKRIEASGRPLLASWEEIDREMADRRGEPLDESDR